MDDLNIEEEKFLSFKIIQSGEIKNLLLNEVNLRRKFNEIYFSILKEFKLNPRDTYLSNEEGRMIGTLDLNLSLEEVVKKFGYILKIYYEKIF
ncbi:MAG: hypothetical protein KAW51_00970 [Candidatus Lokiarchaeota archaeon]|nr:hypothetical protein [Candidatus Lokiarchaeota archaeon]